MTAMMSERDPRSGPAKVAFSRRPELPGVECLHVYRWDHPLSFYVSGFGIPYVIESHSTVHFGRTRVTSADQDVFVWEPGTVFGHLRMPHPETVKVLLFPTQLWGQVSHDLGSDGNKLHTVVNTLKNPKVLGSLRLFYEGFESKAATPLALESRLLQMLRTVQECVLGNASRPGTPSSGVRSWAVKQARALIDERCSEKLTLEDLALETGLSRFQILRLFAREVGVPPHAYQLHRRIDRAKRLLAEGVPPAHVAAELGFCDQSHFNRCFKRKLGVTPLEYFSG